MERCMSNSSVDFMNSSNIEMFRVNGDRPPQNTLCYNIEPSWRLGWDDRRDTLVDRKWIWECHTTGIPDSWAKFWTHECNSWPETFMKAPKVEDLKKGTCWPFILQHRATDSSTKVNPGGGVTLSMNRGFVEEIFEYWIAFCIRCVDGYSRSLRIIRNYLTRSPNTIEFSQHM